MLSKIVDRWTWLMTGLGKKISMAFIIGILVFSLSWNSGVCDNPLPPIENYEATLAPEQHIYGEYQDDDNNTLEIEEGVNLYLWWNVTDPPNGMIDFFICDLDAYNSWNESGSTASIEKYEAQTNNTDTVKFEVPSTGEWRFVWHNTETDVLNLTITFDDDPLPPFPPEPEKESKLWYYLVATAIIIAVFLAAAWIVITERLKQKRAST